MDSFMVSYLNNFSPTGFEMPGQKLWMEYMRPLVDEFITDAYGTVVGVVNPGQPYKVVVEAHADEISWFVAYINSDGFIYVKRNGGSDPVIAPSKRVCIHTPNGIVRGVFGWPAIHLRKTKDDAPKLTNIFIDVGAKDDKEVKAMGIHVGTVITFEDEVMELNNKYIVGRGLDNRMGGYILSQVAKHLKETGHQVPFTLYFVNAVQEEVGLRGAQMIAERLNPDVALVLDVTHDTSTPMIDKIEEGDLRCGRGPVLTIGPAVHNKVLRVIRDIAEVHEISHQIDAASRSTGTDADAFAYSNAGVPTALISLPLRYMHTTVEMVNKEDLADTIKLLAEVVKGLEAGNSYSYFD